MPDEPFAEVKMIPLSQYAQRQYLIETNIRPGSLKVEVSLLQSFQEYPDKTCEPYILLRAASPVGYDPVI